MQNNSCNRSDAHYTLFEDITIVEVLLIGMSKPEDVIIKTQEIKTVESVNKEKNFRAFCKRYLKKLSVQNRFNS